MAGEKLSLKWNDFQASAANSFLSLREEKDFYDVTLVSEDQIMFDSHKVVLSASSQFFKSLIKNVKSNPNPLLYLGGVSSKNLNYCLDYMYNGEVHILHDDIEGCLLDQVISIVPGPIRDEHSLCQPIRTYLTASVISLCSAAGGM